MHVEGVVLPGRRARLAHEGLETLLALRRELVDDPRPSAADAADGGGRWGLDDPALLEQAPQAGVERAVGQGPEGAERRVEPLAQLVAVHRALVEQAQDREGEQVGAPGHAVSFHDDGPGDRGVAR